MIIISMNDSDVNALATAKLREMHEIRHSFIYPNIGDVGPDEEVIIVDFDANGSFQQTISKEALSQFLVQNKLIQNQGILNLLVSDVTKGNSIAVYTAALVHYLQTEYEISVEARYIEDLNYDNVFISPPTQTKDTWKVFGVDNGIICNNYNGFFANAQKQLIWEGQDIIEWCVEANNIVRNVSKLPDELNIGDAYQVSL